jgi:exodeoxyribonuclease V gamma subunit
MLTIIQSNRLEILAHKLAYDSVEHPPDSVFEPVCVVVPHVGLGQWLSHQMTQHLGVAANIQFTLPAAFIWQTLDRYLGPLPALSGFECDALLWQIYAQLNQDLSDPVFMPLQQYLKTADYSARYSLARRLAQVYERYQIFRPDWIKNWDQGRSDNSAAPVWQALLWQRVSAAIGQRHRIDLLREFSKTLSNQKKPLQHLPKTIYVFGTSTMPPSLWRWFEEIATHTEVRLYLPTPSEGWWADLVPKRKTNASIKLSPLNETEYEQEHAAHSLLEAWGAVGRDFQEMLYSGSGASAEIECFDSAYQHSLLSLLQHSFLNVDSSFLRHVSLPNNDRSLMIHVCPNVQREVEVVYDALRRAFDEDETLTPSDVVILCVDLDIYAPYVNAIFSTVGSQQSIPFRIADHSVASGLPLVMAFMRLLGLTESRMTIQELLSWLDLPAIRARIKLEEEDVELVCSWLLRAGFRWGLDASFREKYGAGDDAIGSFRFAMSRLFMGYVFGQVRGITEPVSPVCEVSGQAIAALSAFADLVDNFIQCSIEWSKPRTMSAWQTCLLAAWDRFFVIDARLDDEKGAYAYISDALAQLQQQADASQCFIEIPFEVVRLALHDVLSKPRFHRPWLSGSVCVTSIVPMRHVPFRIVFVLGLGQQSFPRREVTDTLDAMAHEFRAGDRNPQEEDRWLFLDAIQSARQQLHLSYSGSYLTDVAPMPSMLITQLLDCITHEVFQGDKARCEQAIVRHYPLQPFAEDCFSPLSAEPSYAAAWLPAKIVVHPQAFRTPLKLGIKASLKLDELIAYFRHPAKFFLQQLNIKQLIQQAVHEQDATEVNALAHYAIRQALFDAACQGEINDAELVARFTADQLLPAGMAGRALWEEARADVVALHHKFVAVVGEENGSLARVLSFQLPVSNRMLDVQRIVNRHGDVIDRHAGSLRPERLLEHWIAWLALSAQGVARRWVTTGFDQGKPTVFCFEPVAGAALLLANYLQQMEEAQNNNLPAWTPRSSAAAAAALFAGRSDAEALSAAQKIWRGDRFQRVLGEGEDRSWKIVAASWNPLNESDFLELARTTYTPLLAMLEQSPS